MKPGEEVEEEEEEVEELEGLEEQELEEEEEVGFQLPVLITRYRNPRRSESFHRVSESQLQRFLFNRDMTFYGRLLPVCE